MAEVLDYSGAACRCGKPALPLILPWVVRMGRGRFLCSSCLLRPNWWAGAFCLAPVILTICSLLFAPMHLDTRWALLAVFGWIVCGVLATSIFFGVLAWPELNWERGCTRHLGGLGDRGRWREVLSEGRGFLHDRQDKAAFGVGAWVAVADVYVGGPEELAEAERLSDQGLRAYRAAGAGSAAVGAMATVRAFVLLERGDAEGAETLLKEARGHLDAVRGLWAVDAAEKAAAHLHAELCRRKGDGEGETRWRAEARRLDPAGYYAKDWTAPASVERKEQVEMGDSFRGG